MKLLQAAMAAGVGVSSLAVLVVLAAEPPEVETLAPPAAAAAGPPLVTPAEELGYALGYRIGQRIIADHRALGTPLDPAALGRGLADAVRDAPPQLDETGFRRVLSAFEQRMEERDREIAARMAAAAGENLAAGAAFLAANAKQDGVTTLPSGLQYEVLVEGIGVLGSRVAQSPPPRLVGHLCPREADDPRVGRQFTGSLQAVEGRHEFATGEIAGCTKDHNSDN
jgi:FKBP-type peptidyl-prolyl cis-trans isomerase